MPKPWPKPKFIRHRYIMIAIPISPSPRGLFKTARDRHTCQARAEEFFSPFKACEFVKIFSSVIQEDQMKLVE